MMEVIEIEIEYSNQSGCVTTCWIQNETWEPAQHCTQFHMKNKSENQVLFKNRASNISSHR